MQIQIASWDFGVIIGTFLISSLLVYKSYQKMVLPGKKLDKRIGNPQWDFTKSWATTLTSVGALLGTLLLTPELTGIKMQSGLNLFFGLVVLIAPLMYAASAKRLPSDPGVKNGTYVYQGTVRMFLITCALTIWAVSGELITVATSFYILLQGIFISVLSLIVLSLFLLLTIIYTFYYAYWSIQWTLEDLLTDKTTRQNLMKVRKKHSLGVEEAILPKMIEALTPDEKKEAEDLNPPLKNWSLL